MNQENSTILIVEDEQAVLTLTRLMLESLGYRVHSTTRASEAIEIVEQQGEAIDLILSDVVMPELDGWQLCEKLRAINPRLRFLFMSGYTADAAIRQNIMTEGLPCILKPFALSELAAKIRAVLDE